MDVLNEAGDEKLYKYPLLLFFFISLVVNTTKRTSPKMRVGKEMRAFVAILIICGTTVNPVPVASPAADPAAEPFLPILPFLPFFASLPLALTGAVLAGEKIIEEDRKLRERQELESNEETTTSRVIQFTGTAPIV